MSTISTLRTTAFLLLGTALAAQTATPPQKPAPSQKSAPAASASASKAKTASTPAAAPRRPALAVAPLRPAASAKAPVAKTASAGKIAPKAAPATPKPAPAAATKAEAAPEKEAAPEEAHKTASVAQRDPFLSIIRDRGVVTPVCTAAGKQCLIPDQLVLRGVVKSADGMIALVENAQRKAYFLREKDPVMNGEVIQITGDSITFRQKVTDRAGRVNTRDVVKRIPGGAPA